MVAQPKDDVKGPPSSGREFVLQALKPKKENYNPFVWHGYYVTALSSLNLNGEMSLKGFNPGEQHQGRIFSEELSDGWTDIFITPFNEAITYGGL